ncbi:MAG: ECF transporter S component [Sphaerochaetaceae bacterium]|jgi:thiamine transporter ThiT
MNSMSSVKKSMFTAVCIALCVVLPMAFHGVKNAGSVFSPMHLPVYVCGLICGWPYGLLCGLAGPLLSSLLTGMPPVSYLPPMMIELAVYGTVSGLLMTFLHTGKTYADLYVSLVAAMLAGRLLAGFSRALIFAHGSYSLHAWVVGYFVTSLPGTIIHLAVIPSIVVALMKSRLVPQRYGA